MKKLLRWLFEPRIEKRESSPLDKMWTSKTFSSEAIKATHEERSKGERFEEFTSIEKLRKPELEPEPELKKPTEKESLSKGDWYIGSLISMVKNHFPKKGIYTTETIVRKYELGTDVHILPMEENGTDRRYDPYWDIEYVLPINKKPEDYFILYEQLGDHQYNEISPLHSEFKGDQDFLVIRSNTKVVELHLCKIGKNHYGNDDVQFLKEVITSIY